MNLQISDEVEQDLVDGFPFYESQQVRLGEYFLETLFSDIDSLRLCTGIPSVHFGYHRLLFRRFPYAVHHRVDGETAIVWAVCDCRQDPARIEDRLTSSAEG